MTVTAVSEDDQDRLNALGSIAETLVANARELIGDSDDAGASLAMVEGWAAALRPESYDAKHTRMGMCSSSSRLRSLLRRGFSRAKWKSSEAVTPSG